MDNVEALQDPVESLSNRELAFAEAYLISLNKAEAARKAGAPAASSHVQGHALYNRPHVTAYIIQKLKERTISTEGVIQLVANIAESNVADYFKTTTVIEYPRKKVSLKFVIAQLVEEALQEKMYAEKVELDEEELQAHRRKIKGIERNIAKLEVELARNPKATRMVDLDPIEVKTRVLDINKVIADKEKGRIRKFKQNKDGTVELEFYSALEAQDKLLRLNGAFEKDNAQKGISLEVNVSKEEAKTIKAALDSEI